MEIKLYKMHNGLTSTTIPLRSTFRFTMEPSDRRSNRKPLLLMEHSAGHENLGAINITCFFINKNNLQNLIKDHP